MQALVLEQLHQAPALQEVPEPACAPGEALVKLKSAALNHRDLWITKGQYPGITLPIILGSDGCGVVESVDEAHKNWMGKEVIFNPGLNWGDDPHVQSPHYTILGLPRNGTLCQRITIPVENLSTKPAHLTARQAAALPLAGLTAWRALMTRAQLQPGEKVLISGIGGGVALFAFQFAKAQGAKVWVTSSSKEKIKRALSLGAKGGVLYNKELWWQRAGDLPSGGFDVIIDSAGGQGFGSLVRLLSPGGRLAFFGGTRGEWPPISPQQLFFRQASILATTMGSPADFAAMCAFVTKHKIVPIIDDTFVLQQGPAAFSRLRHPSRFGKIVLTISA